MESKSCWASLTAVLRCALAVSVCMASRRRRHCRRLSSSLARSWVLGGVWAARKAWTCGARLRTESSSDWMYMMARCSSEGASRVRGLSWGTRTMDERGVRPYADTGGGDEREGGEGKETYGWHGRLS